MSVLWLQEMMKKMKKERRARIDYHRAWTTSCTSCPFSGRCCLRSCHLQVYMPPSETVQICCVCFCPKVDIVRGCLMPRVSQNFCWQTCDQRFWYRTFLSATKFFPFCFMQQQNSSFDNKKVLHGCHEVSDIDLCPKFSCPCFVQHFVLFSPTTFSLNTFFWSFRETVFFSNGNAHSIVFSRLLEWMGCVYGIYHRDWCFDSPHWGFSWGPWMYHWTEVISDCHKFSCNWHQLARFERHRNTMIYWWRCLVTDFARCNA